MNESTEKLIRELADKLGTTTEHLWGVVIAQAPIAGWRLTAVAALFLTCSIAAMLLSRKLYLCVLGDGGEVADAALAGTVPATVSTAFLYASLSFAYDAVTSFYNPEYWALMQIVKYLR